MYVEWQNLFCQEVVDTKSYRRPIGSFKGDYVKLYLACVSRAARRDKTIKRLSKGRRFTVLSKILKGLQ
jgi:hypothetical protein